MSLLRPVLLRSAIVALALGTSVAFVAGCPEEPQPKPDGQLDPPPQGEGVQITTPKLTINPGDEVQNCYFFQVKDLEKAGGLDPTKALNLHRIEISQKDGSHHMNIFRVRTIVKDDPSTPDVVEGLDPANGPSLGLNGKGECFKSSNWADWPLVANTQQDGKLDWTFPDGVANKIDPDEWLMVQTHYVNATTQKTPDGTGQVAINFWTLQDADVKYEMGTLFATQQSIRVCQSNPNPTFTKSCQVKSSTPVHIIAANGHFHSRGKEFDIYKWDGQSAELPPESDRFYRSSSWNEPPMDHSPDLDLTLPANGGILYSCEYQWQPPDPAVGCEGLNAFDKSKYMTADEDLDCCYTFGPIVEKNEHCNAFVYYYPKADDVACF